MIQIVSLEICANPSKIMSNVIYSTYILKYVNLILDIVFFYSPNQLERTCTTKSTIIGGWCCYLVK